MTLTHTWPVSGPRPRVIKLTPSSWAAVLPTGRLIVHPTHTRALAAALATTRTTVPRLVDALEKVLNLHFRAQPIPAAYGTQEGGDYCRTCAEDWPCPTVEAITRALEGETDD